MATTVDYILKLGVDQAKKALKDVAKESRDTEKGFKNMAKSMAKSAVAIGAAVAGAGAAIIVFGQQVADLANELTDASTKTGLATDTLAGLKLAAEGSGLSFKNLENGLIRFQSSVVDAASGTGAASDAFAAMGINVRDSVTGELKDADALFKETTDALGAMENATLRNALAIDLFGQRAGPALAQAGVLGNMESFAEMANEFGINMEDAAEEAGRFQRAMAEIKLVLEGVFSDLLTAATGTTKLSEGLFKVSDNIVYFGSIAADVLGNMSAFVRALIEGFKGIASGIKDSGRAFLAVLSGDFEEAKNISLNATQFIGQQFQKMLEEATTGLSDTGKMIRDAEAAVERQRELRAAIMAGGAAEGGRGIAPTEAAAVQTVKFDTSEFDETFGNISSELDDSFKGLIESLDGLPETVSKAFRIGVAGMVSSIAIQAASGPANFVNVIGDALSSLTMGMSGIIAESITGIARLGEKTPKEIQQEFEAFAKAFEKGLKNLPRILIGILPRFVIALIKGFAQAIFELPFILKESLDAAFRNIWESIKDFFRRIFTKEGREEARAERGEPSMAAKFLNLLLTGQEGFMAGGIMRAQSGIRFTGAKRGLAMLHEGESVIPASGRTGQAEQRSFNQAGNGNGINIVINSAVVENRAIDELVRKLEHRFGTFGAGKSSIIGR